MPVQVTPLLREMFVIFVLAKLMGEIFERLRLPAVLGEILAGIIAGPYALKIAVPSATIFSLAQLGAVFLLFMIGLQTRPKELIRVGNQAMQVALAGMVLPFFAGFIYLTLLHHAGHETTFVAAAMVATSVGITARVLRDMNVLETRPAQIILGAAVFDDVLGMVLLALVVGLASATGVDWLQLGVLGAEALGFVALMLFLAPRVVGRVSPQLERMSTHNPQLVLSLAICLGLSVVAETIGLTAIIGAFFAGLAFAEYAKEWNLRPRVNAISEFLSPYFFYTMGARLDIRAFNGEVWATAIVISILAILAKIIGCGLPVLREGKHLAAQVGIGMVPRGEVGLIIALIGLQMKMISQAAYGVVVFMTAITTLLAPPLVRHAFRREREQASTVVSATTAQPYERPV
jgi:Kef-type K+ transport system membrane component KefB